MQFPIDLKMKTFTPTYTFDLANDCVTDSMGKELQLDDVKTNKFNTIENFRSVKIIGPPPSEYHELSQVFLGFLNEHLIEIETLILEKPTKQLLIAIGQFAERTTKALHLQIIDSDFVSITQGVPHLKHLICSIAQLLVFGKNVNIEKMALTVTDNDFSTLLLIYKFISTKPKLTRILCEFHDNALNVVPGQKGKQTLEDIVEQMHSFSGKSRKYEYLMVSDTSNLFGIDVDSKTLQTSSITLMKKYMFDFKHLRVHIATSKQSEEFHDFIEEYEDLWSIQSLYIKVRDTAAETIHSSMLLRTFRGKLTIEAYYVSEISAEKVPLDSIVRDNGSVKLSIKGEDGFFIKFIKDDTTLLRVESDKSRYRLMHSLIKKICFLEQLRVLNILNVALSQYVLEYANYPESFPALERLYLDSLEVTVLKRSPDIFDKKSLNHIVIRDAKTVYRLDEVCAKPFGWRVDVMSEIQRFAYDRKEEYVDLLEKRNIGSEPKRPSYSDSGEKNIKHIVLFESDE